MVKIQRQVIKNQHVFVGLEDAKKTWVVCVRHKGVMINETSMPADYEVLKRYFQNNLPECTITVMYEAGFRGFNLHDKLTADGWKCIVTPPHTVTKEKCQRQKNDRVDSRRLAKNLENGDYKSCAVPDRKRREDRQLSRLYSMVQRDITRNCNRIRRAIEFHGLESHFPNGAWGESTYRQAREKIATMDLSPSLKYSVATIFSVLETLWDCRKALRRELAKLSKEECYKRYFEIINSVPGIGPLTAMRLVLEWGDVTRFNRKEEFNNYTGLIPRDYSTGEQDHKGHITKQGCRWVRGWLIECAWVAIRHDPVLFDKFHRVVLGSGSKKKAIVAVARKMALRIRALLISGELYAIGIVK